MRNLQMALKMSTRTSTGALLLFFPSTKKNAPLSECTPQRTGYLKGSQTCHFTNQEKYRPNRYELQEINLLGSLKRGENPSVGTIVLDDSVHHHAFQFCVQIIRPSTREDPRLLGRRTSLRTSPLRI